MEQKNNSTKVLLVIVLIILIAIGLWALSRDPAAPEGTKVTDNFGTSSVDTTPVAPTSTTHGSDHPAPSTSSVPTTTVNRKYKDGTYKALGNYRSPAGEESVEISLTIKNSIITSAQFTGKATNPNSQRLQGLFKAGFTEKVVGRNIDELSLTVVNGSSLTPKGFMDALIDIKAEASLS